MSLGRVGKSAATLGQAREAQEYTDRLAALGSTERLNRSPRPSTPEAP
jgi:hypothetical protein